MPSGTQGITPIVEGAGKSERWALPNGSRVGYLGALAYECNKANHEQRLGAPEFTPSDIQRRLHALDSQLYLRNVITREAANTLRHPQSTPYAPLLPAPLPGYEHGRIPVQYTSHQQHAEAPNSSAHGQDGWYEENHSVLPTLEAPYSGPPGPTNLTPTARSDTAASSLFRAPLPLFLSLGGFLHVAK
ncbi:hypothetical protein JCM8547_005643 [Rhodosporidiobolus lusitaniae]